MNFFRSLVGIFLVLVMTLCASCSKKYTKFVWPSDGKQGMIKVEGGEIPYRLYGENKKGTPIIIVHGGPGGNYSKFYPLFELAKDRPILFYNQIGSAGSKFDENHKTVETSHSIMTTEHYINELQSVIDYFGFNEFILFGQSWGTMLVTEYALFKKPAGLKKIILSGPFLNVDIWIQDAERLIKTLPNGDEKWKYVEECIKKSKTDPDIFKNDKKYNEINDEYTDNFNTRNIERKAEIPDKEPTPQVLNEKTNNMVDADTYNYMWGPSEFTCTGTLKGDDVTKRLKGINQPILYISGEYDSGTPEASRYYATCSNDAKVVVIKNAGHSSYFDNTPDVLKAVNDFIK